jgi:hypothetical protein
LQAGHCGGDADSPGPAFGEAEPQSAAAAGQAAGDGEDAQPQPPGFPAAGVPPRASPALRGALHAGRWRRAAGIGRVQELLAADPFDEASAKVSRWLAIDMGQGPGAIRGEVEVWDFTGLPDVFRLARHVLLREDEQALALISTLLADGTLTKGQLAAWPLFDRFGSEGRLPG